MSYQLGGHPLNEVERQQSLHRQSDDHLRDALAASVGSPAQAFFQAGYLALLASLSAEEVKSFQDQPNAGAVALAASRISLSLTDQALGEHGARSYYSEDRSEFGSIDTWSAWAIRARRAVGWNGEPLAA